MNNNDYFSLYTSLTPFDDEHFILTTFEIYATYDHAKGCTRIIIKNADTKSEYIIYFGYILRLGNDIFNAAKALIDTGLLI